MTPYRVPRRRLARAALKMISVRMRCYFSRVVPVNVPFDCHIVSGGGSGTTMLMEFLAQHLRTNDPGDRDEFKHLPRPAYRYTKDVKVIFLLGSPCEAVISLWGRGFERWHAFKLGRFMPEKRPLPLFLSAGQDRLGLERQFDNWTDARLRSYPVLFLRFETIWDNLNVLARFLGLKPEIFDSFPKKLRRASVLADLTPEELCKIEAIYGRLRAKIDRLGPWAIT